MFNEAIEKNVVHKAMGVALPSQNDWLYESQMLYWKTLKDLADKDESDEILRVAPAVTPNVIAALRKCKPSDIRKLCTGQICSLKPVLPETTLLSILNGESDQSTIALQILCNGNFEE